MPIKAVIYMSQLARRRSASFYLEMLDIALVANSSTKVDWFKFKRAQFEMFLETPKLPEKPSESRAVDPGSATGRLLLMAAARSMRGGN